MIPLLAYRPLAQILEEPFVAAVLPPLLERHQRSVDILRQRAEEKDGTIFFDITDLELEGYNKFIPYYLHPDSVYSIGLSKSSFRVKVSVGSNPWSKREPTVNLAKVCERYGGGGHARVGAISFDVTQDDAARKAAMEIVEELRASVRQQSLTAAPTGLSNDVRMTFICTESTIPDTSKACARSPPLSSRKGSSSFLPASVCSPCGTKIFWGGGEPAGISSR